MHRRIATNRFYVNTGKSITEKCALSNAEAESLIHLLGECNYTQFFWKELKNWLKRKLSSEVILTTA